MSRSGALCVIASGIGLAACLPASATPASRTSVYFEGDAFALSEPIAIKSLFSKFTGPLKAGNAGVTHNRIETGVGLGSWRYGLQYRLGYEIDASRDFVEAYHALQNGTPLDPGRDYSLRLRGWHVEAQGVRIAYNNPAQFRHGNMLLGVGIGATWLRGQAFLDGSLAGAGVATDAESLVYSADIRYEYSRDVLFKREVDKPSGWGLAADLSLQLAWGDDINVRIRIDDILGFMRWSRAPFTDAIISSQPEGDRPGGGANPILTGFEGFASSTQKLRRHGTLDAEYRLAGLWHLGLTARWTGVTLDAGATAAYEIHPSLRAEIIYFPEYQAIGVGLRGRSFGFRMTVDDASINRTRFASIQISVAHSF